MKTTLTKEKAQEFIDSLDSYRKYGKIIYSFSNDTCLGNDWKLVEEYNGQFSGGYYTTIWKQGQYNLIIECDPEGNIIKEELRSTGSIS